jgi:FkbM family methyltransferase
MKYIILSRLRKAGFDLSRVRPNLVDFLRDRKIDVVLDVGANAGQFGRWLRNHGYIGRIISFEPISSVFQLLQREASGDQLWESKQFALGSECGVADIKISADSRFSSFLDRTKTAEYLFADSQCWSTERVQVVTLDEFTKKLNGNIFLKIDTQGYEQAVLSGATELMGRLCGVHLELPLIHLYRDTWTFPQAIEFMMRRGFAVSQVTPVNFSPVDKVSLVEVDVTFRRLDGAIDIVLMADRGPKLAAEH